MNKLYTYVMLSDVLTKFFKCKHEKLYNEPDF